MVHDFLCPTLRSSILSKCLFSYYWYLISYTVCPIAFIFIVCLVGYILLWLLIIQVNSCKFILGSWLHLVPLGHRSFVSGV